MKINTYKCDDCQAEFEGLGGGKICPACEGESLKQTGEREVDPEELGGGCSGCAGCQHGCES